MDRLTLPTWIVCLFLLAFVAVCPSSPSAETERLHAAKPTPEQVEWLSRNSMFVCLDPCAWQGNEYDDHTTPLSAINPTKLDTDQWCEVAKSWGAGQILFVAKHTGGFCWWQTETSNYGIKETPFKDGKGDVLAELSQSCEKYGLTLAIYVSPIDDRLRAHAGGKTADPNDQEKYNAIFRQQMTEVLSNYGPVTEVWFDGSLIIPVQDIIEKYAPKAMQFQGPYATIRWSGNESGVAPYPTWQTVKKADAESGIATAAHSNPNGDVWLPFEINTTLLDHKWFWAPDADPLMKSLDKLMSIYYTSVGRGCPLLLNSTPDTTGLIPESHVKRYKDFYAEIQRRFARPVAENKGGQTETIVLELPEVMPINHVMLAEDVREGQRIREYVIEGRREKDWVALVPNGSSVGYNRIDRFDAQEVSAIRLRVTKSVGTPLVTRLAAFHVTDLDGTIADEPGVVYPIEQDWVEVMRWTPELLSRSKGVFDISPHIRRPGEFRMVFKNEEGDLVEMEKVDLIVKELVAESRVRKNSDNNSEYLLYRMEQVTDQTPTKLRIVPKDKTSSGAVYMRLVD